MALANKKSELGKIAKKGKGNSNVDGICKFGKVELANRPFGIPLIGTELQSIVIKGAFNQ